MLKKVKKLSSKKNTGILATSFEPDFSGSYSTSDPMYDLPQTSQQQQSSSQSSSMDRSGNGMKQSSSSSQPRKSRRGNVSNPTASSIPPSQQQQQQQPPSEINPRHRRLRSTEILERDMRQMNVQQQQQPPSQSSSVDKSPVRPTQQPPPPRNHRSQPSDNLRNSGGSRDSINNNMNQPMNRRSSTGAGDPYRDPGRKSPAELPMVNRNSAPPPPISEPKMIRMSSMDHSNGSGGDPGGRNTPSAAVDSRGRTTPIEKTNRRPSNDPQIRGVDPMPPPPMSRRRSNDNSGYNDQRQPVSRRQSTDYNNGNNRPSNNPPPPQSSQHHPPNNIKQHAMSRRHTNDESYGRNTSNDQPLHPPTSRRHSAAEVEPLHPPTSRRNSAAEVEPLHPPTSRRNSASEVGYGHHNNIDVNTYDNNHRGGPPANNDASMYRSEPIQQQQPRVQRRSSQEVSHGYDELSQRQNNRPNIPGSRSSHQQQHRSSTNNEQQSRPSGILKSGNNNHNLKIRVNKLKKVALDNANKGLWLESHNLLLEALALQKDLQHDYLEKAHTCHHLGLALNRLRKYDSALDALYDSLQLRKKYGGDQLDIAATVHTIGIVKGFSGDYVGAIKNLRIAATIQKSILGRPDETTLRILEDFEMKL